MSETYEVVEVNKEQVDLIHSKGQLVLPELELHPNQYLVLKDPITRASAIGRVDSDSTTILRVVDTSKKRRFRIKPKNLEQIIVLDALLSNIPAIALTGIAGAGKTILSIAAALYLLDQGKIDKIIITRPMSTIGKYQLGFLPGFASEKFEPYLLNYRYNFEQLLGHYEAMDGLIGSGRMQILPLQLMRGASFAKTMVLVDEAQVLTPEDIISIGTRIGEGSRIVFLGDLDQRDEPIAKEETGLYKFYSSEKAKESPLVAQLSMTTCVRSSLAAQFSSFLG